METYRRLRLLLHLFACSARRQLIHFETVGRNIQNAQIGDDALDHARAGQRQGAMAQQFGAAVLSRVLHQRDDPLYARDKIHRPTHALSLIHI